MNIKSGARAFSVRGNLDRVIANAVNEAVKAWDNNEELRNLYKPLGAGNLLGSGNVGFLLILIHRKRQIIHFVPPNPKDQMLAHAVLDGNDFYNTTTV